MANKIQYQILIEHMKSGLKDTEIASRMGKSRKTIYNWKRLLLIQVENNEEAELGILLESFHDLLSNNKAFRDRVDKEKEINASDIKRMGQSTLENSKAIANIVKSLGIGRCNRLVNEIFELEGQLNDAKEVIQLLLLNNIDLKEGLAEPNSHASDMARAICA